MDLAFFTGILHTLTQSLPHLVHVKDLEGRYVFANAATLKCFGLEQPQQLYGKKDGDLLPSETYELIQDQDSAVLSTGSPLIDYEEYLKYTSGDAWRVFSTTKLPLKDIHDTILGILTISRSIQNDRLLQNLDMQSQNEMEAKFCEANSELSRAYEELQYERNLLKTIVDYLPDLIYAKDLKSRFVIANPVTAKGMGTFPEQLKGKTDFDYFPEEMAQKFFNDELAVILTGIGIYNKEEQVIDSSTQEIKTFLTSKVPIKDHQQYVIGVVGVGRDISDRKNTERELRDSELRFRSLTELSSDWFWEIDKHLKFSSLTDLKQKCSYTLPDIIGKTLPELPNTTPLAKSWGEYHGLVSARLPFRDLEVAHKLDDGGIAYLSLSGLPVHDEQGHFRGYLGLGRDITARKVSEEQLNYLATHDSLTCLPNRFMFTQLLTFAVSSARRNSSRLAVYFLDLDRFKTINDILGHEAGDFLLLEMARRLKQNLRASDVVGRLGGDEFVILAADIENEAHAIVIAQKILAVVERPVAVFGQNCHVTASIGISLYPESGQNEKTLMKNADIAMYRAKDEGKNTYQLYVQDTQERTLERFSLENSLRQALDKKEFFLHYQAKRDLKTGDVTGVEALIRWQSPERGWIPPVKFIPLAEETGLIVLIGRWVLQMACHQHTQWIADGMQPIAMAVNISMRQFYDEHFIDDLQAAIKDSGISPQYLELEITEGMVMNDAERAIKILNKIKELGVHLAIDDFGVGYSSLAQIRRFPIDTLKIDRSFLRDVPQSNEDSAITEAIIAMGKVLGLTVVAEGVETQEQMEFLKTHGCDQFQGFYFSKPIPADQVLLFIQQQMADTLH